MWPYRDWVIKAFNRNLPFDQFVTWQLAGDLLPNATKEQRLATAFNRLHMQNEEGGDRRGGVPRRLRRRPREHVRHRVPRPDVRVLPLPRPQVRPDHAEGLLLAVRVLPEHRRDRARRRTSPTRRRCRRCCCRTDEQDAKLAELRQAIADEGAGAGGRASRREAGVRRRGWRARRSCRRSPGLVAAYSFDELEGQQGRQRGRRRRSPGNGARGAEARRRARSARRRS